MKRFQRSMAVAFISSVACAAAALDLLSGVAIDATGRPGRNALFTDALEARLVSDNWTRPVHGESLALPDGSSRTWKTTIADTNGWFSGSETRGGYLWLTHIATHEQVVILNARGHGLAYINGEPRTGDPYGYGYVQVPVSMHRGTNDILLGPLRGRVRAALSPAPSPVFFNTADVTSPDLITGQDAEAIAGVVVVNATAQEISGWQLDASIEGKSTRNLVPSIPPFGMRKVVVRFHDIPRTEPGTASLQLTLIPNAKFQDLASTVPVTTAISLRIRRPDQSRKVTFISEIDGSVQYYAVQPAAATPLNSARPGLVLSLHGASVEAIGQADAYAPKPGLHIVCPTNRRPYGFDWEEWGRLDALEVLRHAESTLQTDPRRVYLTGHSMGGHGTWIVGATFPDRFAALAPSAGWISFSSYAGGRNTDSATNAVDLILKRATASSDTLLLATNYLAHSLYVIHGDADDNVPVTQARTMRAHLATFHPRVQSHEQPGAGHWWDGPLGGGADCVDWPPAFEVFENTQLPDPTDHRSPEEVRFVTVNPGVSSRCHWIHVDSQTIPLALSSVRIAKHASEPRIRGITTNIERLRVDLSPEEQAELQSVELDGQVIHLRPKSNPLTFERHSGQWRLAGKSNPAHKNPNRNGPFKEAFQHRMVFVYGTHGTSEENHWAFAKARYDAEVFWYRGNGSMDVVPDFKFRSTNYPGRSVVLYGHRNSNSAWKSLLHDSPVDVRRGSIKIGQRTLQGQDLACLFLRPRPGEDRACVAVISGTGLTGLRLTHRMPYFTSGTGFPDCLIVDGTVYHHGRSGVIAAGFFENDWSLDPTRFAWREPPGQP